jgi:hypothetical protein
MIHHIFSIAAAHPRVDVGRGDVVAEKSVRSRPRRRQMEKRLAGAEIRVG